MSMSYERSCIVRWTAVGCVFGYDGSGCTSALGGRAECERVDAGQLVRRTAAMNLTCSADATGGVFWVLVGVEVQMPNAVVRTRPQDKPMQRVTLTAGCLRAGGVIV